MNLTCLFAALMLNAVIAGLEIHVLIRLSRKIDILKYYTYLSNLVALIGSSVFVVVMIWNLISGNPVPVWLKGLRFTATYMLVTTMFVFSFVLLPWHRSGNLISHDDFSAEVSPKLANLILHYLCPVLAAVSFVLFERQPVLSGSEWTLYGAIPTICYWSIYLFLTAAHLWKDPYDLGKAEKGPRAVIGALLGMLIPAMSMGLDYLLWWQNTLIF